MSLERLRNVKTGEIRDIETNSDEYADLINEVYDHDGSARPKWEITGQHHARRIDDGYIGETDLGYQHKPLPGAEVDVSEVGPELHPERAITDAEKEMGIESWEQKMEDHNLVLPEGTNRPGVEPLDRTPADKRVDEGLKAAGSTSSKNKRGGNGRSSGSGSSSGSSGSGSGSGSKATAGSGSGSPSGSGGSAS